MKPEEIKKILEDLYKIDPSFKNYEKELMKIINKLVADKPETKLSQKFVDELKAKLLTKARELSKRQQKPFWFKVADIFSAQKLAYVGSGALLAILIMIPILSSLNLNAVPKLSFQPKIFSAPENAFGSLTNLDGSQTAPMAAESDTVARGFGGGGGGGGMPDSAGMIAPEYVNYKFVYKGGDLNLTEDKLEVLKRIKGVSSDLSLNSFVQSFDLGLSNLSSFNNARVDNVSLVQDEDYGYYININYTEGSFNIFENWQRWQTNPVCYDQWCDGPERLTIDDVPDDATVINMANNFLNEHNINLTSYGQPEVVNDWLIYYERSEDKSNYYIPETVQVVYPLKIEDKTTYEQSGNKFGLMVMVNFRVNKVSSVNSLTTQNYQSSLYEAETDETRILDLASRGGFYYWSYLDYGDSVEVELGQPETTWVKVWNYNDGQSEELLVPSLVFPIINPPDDPYFYKKNVIVPLVKDVINQDMPTPMPLLESEPAA